MFHYFFMGEFADTCNYFRRLGEIRKERGFFAAAWHEIKSTGLSMVYRFDGLCDALESAAETNYEAAIASVSRNAIPSKDYIDGRTGRETWAKNRAAAKREAILTGRFVSY